MYYSFYSYLSNIVCCNILVSISIHKVISISISFISGSTAHKNYTYKTDRYWQTNNRNRDRLGTVTDDSKERVKTTH